MKGKSSEDAAWLYTIKGSKNLLRFHLQVVFPRYGLEFQLALQNISCMILGNWNNLRRGLVLTRHLWLAFLVGNWIFDNVIIIFWKLSIMVQRILFSFILISWNNLLVITNKRKALKAKVLKQRNCSCSSKICLGTNLLYTKSLWSCLTLCNPMDCSPLGSSIHGILQARTLEWVAMPSSKSDLPDPGIEPVSPALAGSFFYH